MEYIKVSLNKEQIAKVIEMVKYVFPEATVESNDGSTYQLTYSSSDNTSRTYFAYNVFEALVYIIPQKLGMDFVVVDPYNKLSLYNQISERFDRLKDNEESVPKPVVNYGHGMGCFAGDGYCDL